MEAAATDPTAGMVFTRAVHWYRVRREPRAVLAGDRGFFRACLLVTLVGWLIEACWKDAHAEPGYARARTGQALVELACALAARDADGPWARRRDAWYCGSFVALWCGHAWIFSSRALFEGQIGFVGCAYTIALFVHCGGNMARAARGAARAPESGGGV